MTNDDLKKMILETCSMLEACKELLIAITEAIVNDEAKQDQG